MSFVRSGALRVLALMAPERSPLVPDVPTFRELGFDLEYGSFPHAHCSAQHAR